MPTFAYIAIDAHTGKELRGACRAANVMQATAELKAQGLYPTELTTTSPTAEPGAASRRSFSIAWTRSLGGRGSGGLQARAVFTRQLAMMLRAGLPLLRAVEILERQQPSGAFRSAIGTLAETIRSGGPLSEGLAAHPRYFDRLYVNMVKAGEAGGALDGVMLRLAEFQEKAVRIRGRVRAAMTYPLIIMAVTVAVVGALIVFVVPRFEAIFATMLKGRPLPALTQAVLGTSAWVQDHAVLTLVMAAATLVALRGLIRTARGERVVDRLRLIVPVLGELTLKSAVARFTRTFGTLLSSGVQILDALRITRDTAGNVHVAEAIDAVRLRVQAGEGVARPLAATGVFPAMVPSMIEVGEETGALPAMLERVADTYDEEVDRAVTALTAMLEPLMVVVMAAVVGTIVIALFLPLVSIVQSLT